LQRYGGRRRGNHLLLLLGNQDRYRVTIEAARRYAAEAGQDAVHLMLREVTHVAQLGSGDVNLLKGVHEGRAREASEQAHRYRAVDGCHLRVCPSLRTCLRLDLDDEDRAPHGRHGVGCVTLLPLSGHGARSVSRSKEQAVVPATG